MGIAPDVDVSSSIMPAIEDAKSHIVQSLACHGSAGHNSRCTIANPHPASIARQRDDGWRWQRNAAHDIVALAAPPCPWLAEWIAPSIVDSEPLAYAGVDNRHKRQNVGKRAPCVQGLADESVAIRLANNQHGQWG